MRPGATRGPPAERAVGFVPRIGGRVPCDRIATAMPSASGTASARAIQTTGTIHAGTQPGSGTNARTRADNRGRVTPISKSGHAAAAPTSTDSPIFLRGLVSPKSATIAHPNSADTMRPAID